MYFVNIKPRTSFWVQKKHWSKVPYKGMVYCPYTETGLFLARMDGHIFVTGNCNLQTIPKGAELFKFIKDMIENTGVEIDSEQMVVRHPKYGEAPIDESIPDDVVATVRKWIKDEKK